MNSWSVTQFKSLINYHLLGQNWAIFKFIRCEWFKCNTLLFGLVLNLQFWFQCRVETPIKNKLAFNEIFARISNRIFNTTPCAIKYMQCLSFFPFSPSLLLFPSFTLFFPSKIVWINLRSYDTKLCGGRHFKWEFSEENAFERQLVCFNIEANFIRLSSCTRWKVSCLQKAAENGRKLFKWTCWIGFENFVSVH